MDCGDGDGGCVEMQICAEQFFDGIEDGDRKFRSCLRGARAVGLDSGDKGHTLAGSLQIAVDTKMIAAECAGANNGYAQLAFACDGLCPFAFDGFKAATVELKQMVHVFFRLGGRCATEARGACGGTPHTGCSRNKLEQIKSDVFIAAGTETRVVYTVHTE
jgi:hypothetical protein